MKEKGMSRGEWNHIRKAIGGIQNMIDEKCKDKELLVLIKYLSENDCIEKIFENQHIIKTPVVRNGKLVTIGYKPNIWNDWE